MTLLATFCLTPSLPGSAGKSLGPNSYSGRIWGTNGEENIWVALLVEFIFQ